MGRYFYDDQKIKGYSSKIVACIDKNRQEEFHHRPVVTLEQMPLKELKQSLIVVTLQFIYYEEVKKELETKGLIEFTHFIWWQCYEKKVAIVHANCLGREIKAFLTNNRSFMEEYCIYPTPVLDTEAVFAEMKLSDALLSHTDLFFYQKER